MAISAVSALFAVFNSVLIPFQVSRLKSETKSAICIIFTQLMILMEC